MPTWLWIVVAYLIGSVSFAVVVSKLFALPDPHSYGSGNPGATNVLRTGNRAVGGMVRNHSLFCFLAGKGRST